jgi:hypothetical protein
MDKTLLAANIAAAMATTAANIMMRFRMPPSCLLASVLALRLLIGPRPLETSAVRLMNNTAELGAQDEPLLRSTTLDLHLKVRANLPYL